MLSKKNNELNPKESLKSSGLHNSATKEKLDMSKSIHKKGIPHLIMKVNYRKLKFVSDKNPIPDAAISHIYIPQKPKLIALSETATINDIIKWLKSKGYSVKKIQDGRYVFENKMVTESFLVVIANRKRISSKLSPFILEWKEG